MIQGHGNNLLAYGAAIRLDFSSNIAFNNHGHRITAHLQTQLASIRNYPDPGATRLTQMLAEHHNLSPEHVLITNGSAEAFYLIAHYLSRYITRQNTQHRDRHGAPYPTAVQTAICIPAFAEYEDACVLHGHNLQFIPLENFPALDRPSLSTLDSVWLGNPNNPNGVITSPAVILEKCLTAPETIFVLDQAYVQLTSQKDIDIIGMTPPDNLIVTHSLTKEFAIPGLRLGYITAAPSVIATLSAMRPPWNVNALALAAGEFIITHYSSLLPGKEELMGECLFLQKNLTAIEGLEILPSTCNFFLSRLSKGKNAADLKQRLIADYGILIRDASNFRGLGPEFFRVAAQKHSANIELVSAITTIMETL